jgi:hypothetical protein
MKINLCFPGHTYSGNFVFGCLISFISDMFSKFGAENVEILNNGASGLPAAREAISGYRDGTPLDEGNPPFVGKEYDYSLWIDSDMMFAFDDFQRLLDADKQIITGLYLSNTEHGFFAATKFAPEWIVNRAKGSLSPVTIPDIAGKTEPFEVATGSMGFCLIKRGVFEAIKRPYFAHTGYPIFGDGKSIFTSEDTGFFYRAGDAGIKTYVHPQVILGHEKRSIWVPST